MNSPIKQYPGAMEQKQWHGSKKMTGRAWKQELSDQGLIFTKVLAGPMTGDGKGNKIGSSVVQPHD